MNKTIIFSDGASSGNPGAGGWGAVVVAGGMVRELGGPENNVTNNSMELKAAVEALSAVSDNDQILVFTDSAYVVNGVKKWLSGWETRGWKTKAKKEIANLKLWKKLSQLISGKNIEWRHVSGHSGLAGNERTDEIAAGFSIRSSVKLYTGPLSEYRMNVLSTEYDEAKKSRREEGKSRKNIKAYSYVSLLQGVIRIHKTWEECEKTVTGKPARFRKTSNALDEKKLIHEYEKDGGRVI